MPLTTPNAEDSPTYQAQAVLDKTDLAALSLAVQQTGVISGMTVTAGGGYTVNIAAGVIQVGWDQQNVTAVTGLAPAAASSTDRRDIVVCSTTGTVSIVAGTPTTETAVPWTSTSLYNPPVKPSIPANSVLLAEIYIPGGGGTIASGWITDKTTITAVLSSPWPEGLVRLNSLSQMAAPTSAMMMNSQRLTNTGAGLVNTDAAIMSQLGSWIPDPNTWTLSTNTTTVSSSMNTLSACVQTTCTGSTINTTPSTVTVGNTSGFPASGSFNVRSVSGGTNTTVNYTAIGSGTTFTGCTLATGSVTTTTGDQVTGGINVASTTGFPASGSFIVTHGGSYYPVYYTALTSTAFVGCTGYASTLSTSDVVSPGAFTVSGNYTTQYTKGTKLQWAESGTVKYGVVKTSTYASSTTTVYLVPTTDYTMLATNPDTISAFYCYTNPPGFPSAFTWTPGNFGFSANPTVPICAWWTQDGMCYLAYNYILPGTSNTTSYLVTPPISCAATPANIGYSAMGAGEDNTAATITQAYIFGGSTAVVIGKQPSLTNSTAWTGSGSKVAQFLLTYPI